MTIRRLLSRLTGDRSGSVAIEFGIIAPLFIGLLFGSGEAGWLMTKSMLLDHALNKSIRLVRIGGSGAPASHNDFRKLICSQTVLIRDCEQNLLVEMTVVKSAADFPTAAVACVERGKPPPPTAFSTGGRSDMVFVRACLDVDPLLPLVGAGLGLPRNKGGRFDLISVSSFMNEPGV